MVSVVKTSSNLRGTAKWNNSILRDIRRSLLNGIGLERLARAHLIIVTVENRFDSDIVYPKSIKYI